MADKYTIIAEVQLNKVNMQEQLTKLSNDFNRQKKVIIIDENSNKAAIEAVKARILALKSDIASIQKVRIIEDSEGKTNSAVVDYINNAGLANTAVMQLDKKTKEWSLSQTTVTQNLEKARIEAEKLSIAETKRIEKARIESEKLAAQEIASGLKKNSLIDQYLYKLELLKVRNKKAFDLPAVADAEKSLRKMIDCFNKGTASEDDMRKAAENLNLELGKTRKSNMGMADMFGEAAKKMVIWAIATEALYGTLKKIGEAIQYVKDLNKELTNIQIVTGASTKQVADLAVQYNALAKQTGSTTLEVAKGSVEWARQGKTVEETQKLLTASMMMSKLAAMDSADATEKLTAIMNGFNFEASQAQHVLDVLITLDNNYATSTNEIASAMQRSSNSAQLAGVSFEQLASYITIISATTRKSSESIGESLNF